MIFCSGSMSRVKHVVLREELCLCLSCSHRKIMQTPGRVMLGVASGVGSAEGNVCDLLPLPRDGMLACEIVDL